MTRDVNFDSLPAEIGVDSPAMNEIRMAVEDWLQHSKTRSSNWIEESVQEALLVLHRNHFHTQQSLPVRVVFEEWKTYAYRKWISNYRRERRRQTLAREMADTGPYNERDVESGRTLGEMNPLDYIAASFSAAYGIPFEVVSPSVAECFGEMLADYERDVAATNSTDMKNAALKKREVALDLHTGRQGRQLAGQVQRSSGRVSQIKGIVRRRLCACVFAKCDEYRLCNLEIPPIQEMPRERGGFELLEFQSSVAWDESEAIHLIKGGSLSIAIYTGRQEIECCESSEARDSKFTCRNATLLLSLDHPSIPSGQPNAVGLTWRRDAFVLGSYANDGRKAGAVFVIRQQDGTEKAIRLPDNAKVSIKGEVEALAEVDITTNSSTPPLRLHSAEPIAAVEVQPKKGQAKRHTIPAGAAILVLDRNGETLAECSQQAQPHTGEHQDVPQLSRLSTHSAPTTSAEPRRYDWGMPLHITVDPAIQVAGSELVFVYEGEGGKKKGMAAPEAVNLRFRIRFLGNR